VPESRAAGCPLCLGSGAPAFSKDGYQHCRCSVCGSIYVHPAPSPEELAAYYADAGGQQNSQICWAGSSRHAHHAWRWAVRRAEALAGIGPLLDVGCGAGQFLSFARESGWEDVEGVELSPVAAEAARRSSGARVSCADFFAVNLAPGRFAAVSMWDVFEHVREPRRFLARCFEILRPNGVLVVSTPNWRGLTLRARGRESLLVMPPEHLTIATATGVRAALEAAGFVVRGVRTVDVHLRDWLVLGRSALGRRDTAEPGERAAHAKAYSSLTGARAFGALQAAANLALGALRLGDQILVMAQRPSQDASG
jgi:2-polyprenyl-3-methyl-5-hydroxy-6-metoxy-1,4-benzoquinol methylase